MTEEEESSSPDVPVVPEVIAPEAPAAGPANDERSKSRQLQRRRPSSRKCNKNSRRSCCELMEDLNNTEDMNMNMHMHMLKALPERKEDEDIEAGTTNPSPTNNNNDNDNDNGRRRSHMKKNRRQSELMEEVLLGDDDDDELEELQRAEASAAHASLAMARPSIVDTGAGVDMAAAVDVAEDTNAHNIAAAQQIHTIRQRRRSSVLVDDPNEISYHPGNHFQLYAPPRQRQEWGQRQILPRVNWGDLFFDLFYVAAAYNTSEILVESPSAQGCLYFLGCFLNVQCIWMQKMAYDARFVVSDDLFHRLLEILRVVILASVVVHIRPVSELSSSSSTANMFALSLSIAVAWIFCAGNLLELYWMGQGQQAVIRAFTSQGLRILVVGLGLCVAATIVSGKDYFSSDSSSSSSSGYGGGRGLAAAEESISAYDDKITTITTTNSDMPIWLLLWAPVLDYCIQFVKVVFLFPNDGSHKKFVIPLNVDFCIHRYAEFTMLMLGESILSLLIVDVPAENSDYFATFYCSLLTVIFLQYLHFRSMPHAADDHAMRRSKNRGMVWQAFKYSYSCALIALGAAFTRFVLSFSYQVVDDDYHHRVLSGGGGAISLHDFEKLEQQAAHLFSIALSISFFSLDGMSVMNVGLDNCKKRAYCQKTHVYNIKGVVLVALRTGAIVFVATLSQWQTNPEVLAGIGLGVTICQTILRKLGQRYLNKKLENDSTDDSEGAGGEEGPASESDEGGIQEEESERNPQLVNTIREE